MTPYTEPMSYESTDSTTSGLETTQTFASSGDVTSQRHVVTSHSHVVTSTTSVPSTTITPTLMSSTAMELSSTNYQQAAVTQSRFPWNDVSFGLIGGLAALLLMCIVLAVVICRLKRRLKKAHVTLYPMAPAKERAYTPLAPMAKKGLDLEMAHVSQAEDIEEVDSPTFSSPPPAPTFPPRAVTQSSPDKPPELPFRRPNRPAPSEPGKQVQTRVKHKPQEHDDQDGGVENLAFTKEANATHNGQTVELDTDHDDDTYESYDASMYQNIMKFNIQEDTDGNALPYEVPFISKTVKNENKDFIRRQSSSSGLPEMVFNVNETGESNIDSYDAPLTTDHDIYDNDEVEFKMKDTGLPTGNAISSMIFQEDYEDVQTTDSGMKQKTERNSSIVSYAGADDIVINVDTHSNTDILERQSSPSGLPNMAVHVEETSGSDIDDQDIEADPDLYDDVPENEYLDLHENEVREDVKNKSMNVSTQEIVLNTGSYIDTYTDSKQDPSVPILEADEDMDDRNSLYDTMLIGAKIDGELDGDPDIYEDPNEDTMSKDTTRDSIGSVKSENNMETINIDHGGKTTTVSERNVLPPAVGHAQIEPETNLVLPKVPPRRDLMTKPPAPPLITYNQDTIQQDDPDEDLETMTPASVDISNVEMRPGKQVYDINNKASLENSYFLDLEDGSKEISETHHKRVSVHKMGDNEMSLTELVHLYNSEKTNDDSDIKFDIGTETVTSEDTSQQSQASNGILANGNGVCFTEDENLYDVPPPIHRSESSA